MHGTVTDFEAAGVAGGDALELGLPFDISRRLVLLGSLGFGANGFTETFFAFSGGDTLTTGCSRQAATIRSRDLAATTS